MHVKVVIQTNTFSSVKIFKVHGYMKKLENQNVSSYFLFQFWKKNNMRLPPQYVSFSVSRWHKEMNFCMGSKLTALFQFRQPPPPPPLLNYKKRCSKIVHTAIFMLEMLWKFVQLFTLTRFNAVYNTKDCF